MQAFVKFARKLLSTPYESCSRTNLLRRNCLCVVLFDSNSFSKQMVCLHQKIFRKVYETTRFIHHLESHQHVGCWSDHGRICVHITRRAEPQVESAKERCGFQLGHCQLRHV